MKKPWKAPIIVPIIRHAMIAIHTGQCQFTMNTPAKAPISATTEPTERSILPPVRIQHNIPVARIATYAF